MQIDLINGIMETFSPLSFTILLAIPLLAFSYFTIRYKDVPPGPIGLPYFGYLPFMSNADCHLKLDALKKKYGDIFSFTCTGRLYIHLGSFKAFREALVSKSEYFTDRMSGYNLGSQLSNGGISYLTGEPWLAIRKFFVQVMKERGSNSIKSNIAGPLYDSIKSTINDLKAKKGEPINLIELLTEKCATIMRLTLFGETGITEEQIKQFKKLYFGKVMSMKPLNMLMCGTFAKYFIFPFIPHFSEGIKCKNQMMELVYEIINEHKATYDPDNPRDIIDEYFKERDQRRSKGDSTAEYFTDEALVGSVVQFLGDGVFGVASFVSLFVKNVLEFPEEEDKIYKEIVEVIGVERQPAIEDKSKLCYFNAYVLETMRNADFFNVFPTLECTTKQINKCPLYERKVSNTFFKLEINSNGKHFPLPCSIPHCESFLSEETTLRGYKIPRGAILAMNFYSTHYDPEVFEEPKKFNPSRYIQTEGKRRPELPVTFGVGKRSCLGEGYVMMQVFLLLATLVQNFHLRLPEGKKKITVENFLTGKLLICAIAREKC